MKEITEGKIYSPVGNLAEATKWSNFNSRLAWQKCQYFLDSECCIHYNKDNLHSSYYIEWLGITHLTCDENDVLKMLANA